MGGAILGNPGKTIKTTDLRRPDKLQKFKFQQHNYPKQRFVMCTM